MLLIITLYVRSYVNLFEKIFRAIFAPRPPAHFENLHALTKQHHHKNTATKTPSQKNTLLQYLFCYRYFPTMSYFVPPKATATTSHGSTNNIRVPQVNTLVGDSMPNTSNGNVNQNDEAFTAPAPPSPPPKGAPTEAATASPVENVKAPKARGPQTEYEKMKARVRRAFRSDADHQDATDNDMTDDDDDDNSDEEEPMKPWDDPDWVPTTSTGRQKTPNEIRGALKKYIATSGRTQKSLLEEIKVGHCTYHKFMTRSYKNQWSAAKNQTYWAAARFLEKIKHASKKQSSKKKVNSKKRKTALAHSNNSNSVSNKKAKTTPSESRAEGDAWLEGIMAAPVSVPTGAPVFDTCPQIVQKLKQCFEDHPGVTKASFCRIALLGCNNNALAKFMAAPYAEQQGNAVYARAYRFLEMLRIREGQPKTTARLQNEQDQGSEGFSTKPYREPGLHVILVPGECPREASRLMKEHIWKLRRQEKI